MSTSRSDGGGIASMLFCAAGNELFCSNQDEQPSLLYSMLGNQYSQSVQNESETLIKHYEYTEELMKAALDFTHQWCKY